MIGVIKRKASELNFRLKLRKSLQEETKECLYITYEEAKREIERRNKRK